MSKFRCNSDASLETTIGFLRDALNGINKIRPIVRFVCLPYKITGAVVCYRTRYLELCREKVSKRTRRGDGGFCVTAVPKLVSCMPPESLFSFNTIHIKRVIRICNFQVGLLISYIYNWDSHTKISICEVDVRYFRKWHSISEEDLILSAANIKLIIMYLFVALKIKQLRNFWILISRSRVIAQNISR